MLALLLYSFCHWFKINLGLLQILILYTSQHNEIVERKNGHLLE